MSNSIKNNRVTIYFSKRKDKDLAVELEGVEAGDVGWFIKELMRDGIKYRKGVNDVNVAPARPYAKVVNNSDIDYQNSTAGVALDELMNLEVGKKELSIEETEDMFDRL